MRKDLGHRDRGETLIEIVVAIAILGICVAGLLGGLMETWSSSSEHRSLSTVDTVLRSWAEEAKYDIQLQTSPWYQDCASVTDSPAAYNGHLLPAPSDLPSTWSQPYIQGIAYWNSALGTFDAVCTPRTSGTPGDFQLLTLAVSAPDGSLKTLTIGLRSPT